MDVLWWLYLTFPAAILHFYSSEIISCVVV